jgi:transposase-like protein
MPWKASSVMEERLRFVARLLDGEAMTDVCREFGISRKTGYKFFDRYKERSEYFSLTIGQHGLHQLMACHRLPELHPAGRVLKRHLEHPHRRAGGQRR